MTNQNSLYYITLIEKESDKDLLYFGQIIGSDVDSITIDGVLLDKKYFPLRSQLPTDNVLEVWKNNKSVQVLVKKGKWFSQTSFVDSLKEGMKR